MGGYDGYFLLDYLLRNGKKPDNIIYQGSYITFMEINQGLNIKVIDSYKFLPMKLSKLSKACVYSKIVYSRVCSKSIATTMVINEFGKWLNFIVSYVQINIFISECSFLIYDTSYKKLQDKYFLAKSYTNKSFISQLIVNESLITSCIDLPLHL